MILRQKPTAEAEADAEWQKQRWSGSARGKRTYYDKVVAFALCNVVRSVALCTEVYHSPAFHMLVLAAELAVR